MPMGPIPVGKAPHRGALAREARATGTSGRPVSGRGKMTPHGYEPENVGALDLLTEVVDGRRVGRDPMGLPVEVLTAAGHPNRGTRRVVGAMGDVPLVDGLARHKDLRRQCLACAETVAEVRRCAIIDCPIWAYRMGRNPHNPRRGVNPFARSEAAHG